MRLGVFKDGELLGSFALEDGKLSDGEGMGELIVLLPVSRREEKMMGGLSAEMTKPANNLDVCLALKRIFDGYEFKEVTTKSLRKYGTHEGACAAVESRGATPREACGGAPDEKKPRAGRTRRSTSADKPRAKIERPTRVRPTEQAMERVREKYKLFEKLDILQDLPHALKQDVEVKLDSVSTGTEFADKYKEYAEKVGEWDESGRQKIEEKCAAFHTVDPETNETVLMLNEQVIDKHLQPYEVPFMDRFDEFRDPKAMTQEEREMAWNATMADGSTKTFYHEFGHALSRSASDQLRWGEEKWEDREALDQFYYFRQTSIARWYNDYRSGLQKGMRWSAREDGEIKLPSSSPDSYGTSVMKQWGYLGNSAKYAASSEEEYFACMFSAYCTRPTQMMREDPRKYEGFKKALGGWESPVKDLLEGRR